MRTTVSLFLTTCYKRGRLLMNAHSLDYCVYLLLQARLEKERERQRVKQRKFRENPGNRQLALQRTRRWKDENYEEDLKANSLRNREHYQATPVAERQALAKTRRPYFNSYMRHRWHNDPNFKLRKALSTRMLLAIKRGGADKKNKTFKLVGCSLPALKTHLEKQFKPGMAWENYGPVWHIDHVRPCISFDLTQLEQQKICFHFSNLQPLFAIDNIRKGAKLAHV